MNIFRRSSVALYTAWILIESISFIACGFPETWRNYILFEISLAYLICFLLYVVLLCSLVDVSFVSICLHGIMIAHQWLLVSFSLRKLFAGSGYGRVWHGLRFLLITICFLLELSPAASWVNDLLTEDSQRRG